MDDAKVVCGLHRLGHLSRDRQGFGERQRAADHALRHVFAFDELHHDGARRSHVLDAVNLSDVGMIQGSKCPGFPLETREAIGIGRKPGRQDLDRDIPAEPCIDGAIHLAHAALSNEGLDLVRANTCPRGEVEEFGHRLSADVYARQGRAPRGSGSV